MAGRATVGKQPAAGLALIKVLSPRNSAQQCQHAQHQWDARSKNCPHSTPQMFTLTRRRYERQDCQSDGSAPLRLHQIMRASTGILRSNEVAAQLAESVTAKTMTNFANAGNGRS